jgi:uncharacterized membrane protein YkvA (DUF1232 family)
MLRKLTALQDSVRQELKLYQRLLQDSRIPRFSKWLLGLAVVYFVSPIDLIPDIIPVIGHLDDIIVIPALLYLALRRIPKDVLEDCRKRVSEEASISEI